MKTFAASFFFCVVVHLAAVAWVAPESATNDSRLRLGWNDAPFDRADLLLLAMAVVVAFTARSVLYGVGAWMVVGAAVAQLWCFLIWDASPDYVLVDGYIWNASDGLLLLGFAVCIVGVAARLIGLQRRTA
jgi:hypothetical protein